MAYFPNDMPRPYPNHDDAGFWDWCRARKLCFQKCASCDALRHPPTPICPTCLSTEQAWQETIGVGTIYSYTVIHHASHEAVKPNLPYVVAVVEFEDVQGVRLVTNIIDVDPGLVHIGMRVTIVWDDIGDGMFIPRFRPAPMKDA